MNPLFICYSLPLMMFLTKKRGLRYYVVGLNPTTNKSFWVFMKDKDLLTSLDMWREGSID